MLLGTLRTLFAPKTSPNERRDSALNSGRVDLDKERSRACRGEDEKQSVLSSTETVPAARSGSFAPTSLKVIPAAHRSEIAMPSISWVARKAEYATPQGEEHPRPARNAWLHPRPRPEKVRRSGSLDAQAGPSTPSKLRLGASLDKLRRSSSLSKLRRAASLDKPGNAHPGPSQPRRSGSLRAPLRIDTLSISRPTPLAPGTTGSLTGIDLPSPHATVRRAASLPARLPARGPPPSSFRAPERAETPAEERFAARYEAGVGATRYDMGAVVRYQESAGAAGAWGADAGGGGSAGVGHGERPDFESEEGGDVGGGMGGGGVGMGRLRVHMPEAAVVRPAVARPPMLSAIEEKSYKSPAPSLYVLPGSAAHSTRTHTLTTTNRTLTTSSPIEGPSRETLPGHSPATLTAGRKTPRLLLTPSSPTADGWGADMRERHGPHADSFYDDTLASPHADSFVTAGSERNRRSSLASVLGLEGAPSPTSAVTIRSLPFRQFEPSPLALDAEEAEADKRTEAGKGEADVEASDEEMMRRIEHRWDKIGAELPFVLTVPRPPTAQAQAGKGGPATRGGGAFACIRGRRKQPKELILPRWRERADSPGLSMPCAKKEPRRAVAQLDVICRYPYVERRVLVNLLTPGSETGIDASSVSTRPEWTRRVIDPWIIRCRLALWYFSVLLFFGSAVAIVVMIVATHFL
ncbi:hypothetical protein HDZ31DRAFT_44002 [Schizophyllum fasciatum]